MERPRQRFVNRAFSADSLGKIITWGVCPRLELKTRRWRFRRARLCWSRP